MAGKAQHTNFQGGQAQQVDLWKTKLRFLAKSPAGTFDISRYVESVSWQDKSADEQLTRINTQAAMLGSLAMRKPAPHQYKQLLPGFFSALVKGGDARYGALGVMIVAQIGYGSQWRSLWAMRVVPGDNSTVAEQVELSDGAWTLTLADDLWLIGQSVADFKFVKGKKVRKQGWRCHEITHEVCQRFRIPVATLTQGTAWIELPLHQTRLTSPLAVIVAAYKAESKRTGKVFVIRWAAPSGKHPTGALEVIPMKRNPNLYQFRKQLISATLTRSQSTGFATVIEARGYVKKAKQTKQSPATEHDVADHHHPEKVEYVAKNSQAIKRFGWVQKVVDFGSVHSRGELEILAKRSLAVRLVPIRTASLTHPGIATIRRGDAIRINIPEEGYGTGKIAALQTPHSPAQADAKGVSADALKQAEQNEPWLFGLPDPSAMAKTTNPPTEVKKDANTPTVLPVADSGVAFVTSVLHQVSAGSYTIEIGTSFIDVLDPGEVQAEADKTKRDWVGRQRVVHGGGNLANA
jgi:hypothetical protein